MKVGEGAVVAKTAPAAATSAVTSSLASLSTEQRELHITAPKGFRPSDWMDRFVDFLATTHPVSKLRVPHELLTTRFTPQGRVLTVRAELFSSTKKEERGALEQILAFAAAYDMKATVDPQLTPLKIVDAACAEAGLTVAERAC